MKPFSFLPRAFFFGTLSLLISETLCTTTNVTNSLLLAQVAQSIDLPMRTFSANGTHTAKGFTTRQANVTNVEGLRQDCDNININKKLTANFRSDVLGPGVKGFFSKCENIRPDTNLYWFTISSADPAQIDKLCNPNTTFPIILDRQHNTWFIDEPFNCTQRTSPP